MENRTLGQAITVVKIGGNVIDNDEALKQFVADFAAIEGPKALIHGGGKLATRLAERLEIPTQMIEGRRVTDAATIEVVTMVYAGLLNKRIVAALQSKGCNAIGLSGADANVIPAHRRAPKPIDYGFVGDINTDEMGHQTLAALLDAGLTPVFCAITHDGQGTLLNSNADSVASAVAVALTKIAPTDLHFCFEREGVLADINDESSLIKQISSREEFKRLSEEGIISAGMLPKIENALRACESGVRSVVIKHSKRVADHNAGTKITL